MPKGEQRSNRETKKPKANKKPAPAEAGRRPATPAKPASSDDVKKA